MREIEYLPPDLAVKALRLESFDEVYGDRGILGPGRLKVGSNGRLTILACIALMVVDAYVRKCVVVAPRGEMMLLAVVKREQPHHQTSLLISYQQR